MAQHSPITGPEVERLLGIAHGGLAGVRQRSEDFPEPVGNVGRANTYDPDDVSAWAWRNARACDHTGLVAEPLAALADGERTILPSEVWRLPASEEVAGLVLSDRRLYPGRRLTVPPVVTTSADGVATVVANTWRRSDELLGHYVLGAGTCYRFPYSDTMARVDGDRVTFLVADRPAGYMGPVRRVLGLRVDNEGCVLYVVRSGETTSVFPTTGEARVLRADLNLPYVVGRCAFEDRLASGEYAGEVLDLDEVAADLAAPGDDGWQASLV